MASTKIKLDRQARALGMDAEDAKAVLAHLFAQPQNRTVAAYRTLAQQDVRQVWSVSYTTGDGQRGGATLHVRRYPVFGDLFRSVRGDADGMWFASIELARLYAAEHGYTQPYYTSPDLRARRVAKAAA